jgi:uncharacterized damage-inducible protein DinB
VSSEIDLRDAIVAAWRTNNRVTSFLIENLPAEMWAEKVPGAPRRTVRMITGHVHNCRCMWVKMIGGKHGVTVPKRVDRLRVTRAELLPALRRSNKGVVNVLQLGLDQGGEFRGVPWMNLPKDVVHFATYMIAHEGHHRGQIVMLARQLGHRLPREVTTGLWMWSKRAEESV